MHPPFIRNLTLRYEINRIHCSEIEVWQLAVGRLPREDVRRSSTAAEQSELPRLDQTITFKWGRGLKAMETSDVLKQLEINFGLVLNDLEFASHELDARMKDVARCVLLCRLDTAKQQ